MKGNSLPEKKKGESEMENEKIQNGAKKAFSMAANGAMVNVGTIRRTLDVMVREIEKLEEQYWTGNESVDNVLLRVMEICLESQSISNMKTLMLDARKIAKLRPIANGLDNVETAYLENLG